jgi:hypothetical protein
MDLSPLAHALLMQHRADHQPGGGYKAEFKRLPGYTDDQLGRAYEELTAAGLMEAGPEGSTGAASRRVYRLTGGGEATIAGSAAAHATV